MRPFQREGGVASGDFGIRVSWSLSGYLESKKGAECPPTSLSPSPPPPWASLYLPPRQREKPIFERDGLGPRECCISSPCSHPGFTLLCGRKRRVYLGVG